MSSKSFLDQIRIASPCKADWNQMVGSDRVRHCQLCKLNVYNLSEFSRQEAEELVKQTEGQLCVRLFRRTDGTVLTQDCPIGYKALWKKQSQRWGLVLGSLFFILAVALSMARTIPERKVGRIAIPTPKNERVDSLHTGGNETSVKNPIVREMGKPSAPTPSPSSSEEMGGVVATPDAFKPQD